MEVERADCKLKGISRVSQPAMTREVHGRCMRMRTHEEGKEGGGKKEFGKHHRGDGTAAMEFIYALVETCFLIYSFNHATRTCLAKASIAMMASPGFALVATSKLWPTGTAWKKKRKGWGE